MEERKQNIIPVALHSARLIRIVPSTSQQFMQSDLICPVSVYTLQSQLTRRWDNDLTIMYYTI